VDCLWSWVDGDPLNLFILITRSSRLAAIPSKNGLIARTAPATTKREAATDRATTLLASASSLYSESRIMPSSAARGTARGIALGAFGRIHLPFLGIIRHSA
jgi:hypothetical protein